MKIKKGRILILIVILLSVTLTGQIFAQGQKTQKDGPITLTVWNFKYAEEIAGKAFQEMDKLFMEQNPGVIIDHQAQPESNYYQMLLSAFSAKSNLDVFLTHTDQRAWGISESFQVLDADIADVIDTYSATALQACSETNSATSNIKILPLTAQGVGFYYNKDNFRKAGLDPEKAPADWDSFLAACTKLKSAGIAPIILGNQGSPFGIDFIYRVILGTLLSENEIDGFADGRTKFTNPAFVQATEMIKELYDRGFVNVDNGSLPYFVDAIETFKGGNGGFFIGLTSDIAHWKDFGDALGYENIGYFSSVVPQNAKYPQQQVNQGAGVGFAVTNYSPHKEMAAKYVKFMTSGEAGKIFMEATGAIVPNTTIPLDTDNVMLAEILEKMNNHPVPDFMNRVPGGMINDFYNFQTLYFISKEISQSRYIQQVQAIYENNL
ncbi:MAG: ABC transporter substrate-binding protein [Sphaerochaetaceae bacterium]|jgi:raffinose/stachyose/melibiose transport system substrate-binding protein|nr:extracellular solute-binding protein [Sphaerochaetaceae bacterium]HHU88876.1 extracellular solute-binding protein [Spirochaetales bacterium]